MNNRQGLMALEYVLLLVFVAVAALAFGRAAMDGRLAPFFQRILTGISLPIP